MSGVVIWPANIDSEKTKKEGRKISKKLAVERPTRKEIAAVAKKLGLDPKGEKDKAYPREHWERRGLVRVEKIKGKTLILKEIAAAVKKERGH